MYLVPVLFTFYIQDVLKLKKNNSGVKSLRDVAGWGGFLWRGYCADLGCNARIGVYFRCSCGIPAYCLSIIDVYRRWALAYGLGSIQHTFFTFGLRTKIELYIIMFEKYISQLTCNIFHRTTAVLELEVPRIFPGGKGGQCVRLTILPPSRAVVTKSGNFNFLKPCGHIRACNGTDLPLPLPLPIKFQR